MLRLRVGNNLLVIIDGGNIRYMKALQPLIIQVPPGCTEIGIVVTPDLMTVKSQIKPPMSSEAINAILEACKDLPEAEMPLVVDGINRKAN